MLLRRASPRRLDLIPIHFHLARKPAVPIQTIALHILLELVGRQLPHEQAPCCAGDRLGIDSEIDVVGVVIDFIDVIVLVLLLFKDLNSPSLPEHSPMAVVARDRHGALSAN